MGILLLKRTKFRLSRSFLIPFPLQKNTHILIMHKENFIGNIEREFPGSFKKCGVE